MSRILLRDLGRLVPDEPVEVCPYEATDADLPAAFWPEGEAPAVTFGESLEKPPCRDVDAGHLPSEVASFGGTRDGDTRANPARSACRVHWSKQSGLSWSDGYRILLRIETRFWERKERISDVQRILDSCRRLVMLEMGYRVL